MTRNETGQTSYSAINHELIIFREIFLSVAPEQTGRSSETTKIQPYNYTRKLKWVSVCIVLHAG